MSLLRSIFLITDNTVTVGVLITTDSTQHTIDTTTLYTIDTTSTTI